MHETVVNLSAEGCVFFKFRQPIIREIISAGGIRYPNIRKASRAQWAGMPKTYPIPYSIINPPDSRFRYI